MRVSRKNDLSLRLLEIFGAVMLRRTTMEAAADLGISQPAVSLAIKQLEAQLDFSLFHRKNQRLHPTEEARSLFSRIEPILLQLRQVEGHVRELRSGTTGNLRIMATPPLGHSVIPVVLRNFLAERPEATLSYDIRRMEHVIEEVETGAADVGLVLGLYRHQAVNVEVLRTDQMMALVPKDHPLAEEETITPSHCAEYGVIGLDQVSRLGMLVRYAFDSEDVLYQPRVVVRYCHTSAILASVGIGVSVVDSFTARFMTHRDLVAKPFYPEIAVGACLITQKDAPRSRLLSAFIDQVERELSPAGVSG